MATKTSPASGAGRGRSTSVNRPPQASRTCAFTAGRSRRSRATGQPRPQLYTPGSCARGRLGGPEDGQDLVRGQDPPQAAPQILQPEGVQVLPVHAGDAVARDDHPDNPVERIERGAETARVRART